VRCFLQLRQDPPEVTTLRRWFGVNAQGMTPRGAVAALLVSRKDVLVSGRPVQWPLSPLANH
jgi:hypothetical protein